MGGNITYDQPNMDPEIACDLYHVNINNIIEVADLINQITFGRTHLNRADFEDIFSQCLNHTDKFFDALSEVPRGQTEESVTIYEAITSQTFQCHDNYERKMAYLFSVFDFDMNFVLNQCEFQMTVSTTMKSMSKLLQVG